MSNFVPFAPAVNAGRPAALRLRRPPPRPPLVDPAKCTDPDELPPPCGCCGGETFWFVDAHTKRAELICVECIPEPDYWGAWA